MSEDDYVDESEDPELYDAIMASLLLPENGKVPADSRELEEDRRLLKEVMQLSKLEDAKQKGVLNLDHLKRKNKDSKSSNAINEPPKAISTDLSNPSLVPAMPAMFNKKINNSLKPIDFNHSSPKASQKTTLNADPSYGFLP
jgi:hypothetical protein